MTFMCVPFTCGNRFQWKCPQNIASWLSDCTVHSWRFTLAEICISIGKWLMTVAKHGAWTVNVTVIDLHAMERRVQAQTHSEARCINRQCTSSMHVEKEVGKKHCIVQSGFPRQLRTPLASQVNKVQSGCSSSSTAQLKAQEPKLL